MSLENLMDEIRALSADERKRLIGFIAETLDQAEMPRERIAGLNAHLGQGWISPDFDDPLDVS